PEPTQRGRETAWLCHLSQGSSRFSQAWNRAGLHQALAQNAACFVRARASNCLLRPKSVKTSTTSLPIPMIGREFEQSYSNVRISSAVMKTIIGVVLPLFFGGALCADNVVFESGPKKIQLLELFTSEGCSSCPPAEASLGRLVNDPRLWHEFVPVAFHVDYWDQLGWKDPFASAEWTKR